MVNTKSFISKWNERTLEDWGSVVSKEYHSFQLAFMNMMRKIAKDMGAELVNHSYGHYDMSGFIKRGDRYVYFDYSTALCHGGRNRVVLKKNSCDWITPMFCRTAAHEKDYRGGANYNCYFEDCQEVIEELLDTEHQD